MKKTFSILTIAAALLLQPSVNAEENKEKGPDGHKKDGPHKGPGGPMERIQAMKEHLNLTDDQVEKLKAVFAGNKDKFMALREDKTLTEEQKREKAREMMKGQMDQMKGILTPEQEQKWKEHMQKRMKEHGGDRKPGINKAGEKPAEAPKL